MAALAGVSESTVSLVLTGKWGRQRISEETSRRVFDAAKQLDYSPSLLHRSVRRGRTHILSFYNSFRNRQTGDLYMDRMSSAIEHAGGKHGYNILVQCTFDLSEDETFRFLNGGFSDGVILFSPRDDDPLLQRFRNSTLPTVIFNPRAAESILSTVEDDVNYGMGQIAEALIAAGHHRVTIVTQERAGWPDPQLREACLRREYVQRGIGEEGLHTVPMYDDFDGTVEEVLAGPNRPTAVFVWHDLSAYFFLEACLRHGIRVPEDLTIIGYDGINWASSTGHRIASVAVDFDGLAESAVEILDRLISGDSTPVRIKLPGQFLPGSTLAPARS